MYVFLLLCIYGRSATRDVTHNDAKLLQSQSDHLSGGIRVADGQSLGLIGGRGRHPLVTSGKQKEKDGKRRDKIVFFDVGLQRRKC